MARVRMEVVFLSFSLFCLSSAEERQIHTEFLWPDDADICHNATVDSTLNLVHTTATGSNDTLHWILSSYGLPTILLAQTSSYTKLEIDWLKLCSSEAKQMAKSVSFSSEPSYSYAVIFTQLLEYNDIDDDADLEKISSPSAWIHHDFSTFVWDNSSQVSDSATVVFTMNQNTSSLNFQGNGSFSFMLTTVGTVMRSAELPSLALNENSTLLDIVLDDLLPTFENSRFAVEFMLVTSSEDKNTAAIGSNTYIDDEHTPGNFEIIDWTTEGQQQTSGGYTQWKPICYTESKRSIHSLNKAKHYGLTKPDLTHKQPVSLAYAFFGDSLYSSEMTITASNVSFGQVKDKFYANTNFTVWTLAVGYGTPPSDTMSSLVIIILSVGLGLPVAVILFGGIFVCVKKKKEDQHSTPYQTIQ